MFNAEYTSPLGYSQQDFRINIFDNGLQSYAATQEFYTVIGGLWYIVSVSARLDYFLPGCQIDCAILITIPIIGQLLATGWSDTYANGTPFYYDAGRKPSSLGNGFADPLFAA